MSFPKSRTGLSPRNSRAGRSRRASRRVLLVSGVDGLVEAVCLNRLAAAGLEVHRARSIEEAVLRIECEPFVAVFARASTGAGRSTVERLITALGGAGRLASIVALADFYDEAEALGLFQIGVADYLSIREHIDKLAYVATHLPGRHTESRMDRIDASRLTSPLSRRYR